jgi:coiled-coil-helix-coiled-coil-helix domain-containing protein 2
VVVVCVHLLPRGKSSSSVVDGSISICRAPPPPPRAVAHAPPAAVAPPTMAPVGRQPGLFAQMAATAGGVAVGSAVGHTIGAAMTGRRSTSLFHVSSQSFSGGSRGHDQQVAAEQPAGPSSQGLYPAANERYSADRCNLYQKEFMKCLDQSGGDSNQCQGFWEAMKVNESHRSDLFNYFLVVVKECQRYQGSQGMSFFRSFDVFFGVSF